MKKWKRFLVVLGLAALVAGVAVAASPTAWRGDVIFYDDVTFRSSPSIPNDTITNAMVKQDANNLVAAEKLEAQFAVSEMTHTEGTTVTATHDWLHIVQGSAGEIASFEAAIGSAITGDYTVTVDLHKSTGGGAFATVLTTTIGFSSADSARTAKAAVISSASLTDGDILKAVVTVAGSSGTQAQGLACTLTLREDPT
jgi:hypothetical protein